MRTTGSYDDANAVAARERGAMATTFLTRTHSARTPGRMTRLMPWLAGLWAATYLPMALLHLLRDTTPPWTPTPASPLLALSSEQVAVLVVVLGSLAAAALGVLAAGSRSRTHTRAAAGLLLAVGLVVALVVADVRALSFVGYGPMLLLGLVGIGPVPDGVVDPDVYLGSTLALGSTLGGIGMIATAARASARTTGLWPGRTPEQALRIGRWAVAAATLVPLSYAVTRIAWAVGLPLGVREEFLDELGSAKWAGLGLGAFAVVGSLLTLGLVQRWGEVFWSWVPVVGGRRVPVGMALAPALFVAAIVSSAGLSFWSALLGGHLADVPGAEEDWAAWAPELLWPVWGVALAVSALAYRSRRSVGGFPTRGPDA